MPTHRATSDYPPAMLAAIERAHASGELEIPCSSPKALRLEFQKLRGAFRREGHPEKIDQLSFHVSDSAMTIRVKADTGVMRELASALGLSGENQQADSLLDRLKG